MNPKNTVAVVNGQTITAGELYEAMVTDHGPATLERLIINTLIREEAKKAQITVTEDEIEEQLDRVAADYGGRDAFLNLLEQSGFPLEQVRANMEIDLMVKKILTPTIDLSDEAVAAHFEEHADDFVVLDRVNTRHILVETEAEAEEALARLEAGETLRELAPELSVDPSAAINQGDIGWQDRGQLVPEYFDAAFEAEPGSIIGPIRSAYGYHVIEVVDREEGHQPELADIEEEVRQDLLETRLAQETGPWIAKLEEEAQIDNRLLPTEE